MDKQTLIEKITAMVASPSCHPDLKKIANVYLNALAIEQTAAKNFFDELQADVATVDDLIYDINSGLIAKCFGAEGAKQFAAHVDALKAAGAEYCNCFACQIGLEILAEKDALLNGNFADHIAKQTLIEKITALAAATSCHPNLKKVANAYLNALAIEQTAAKNFIAELEESVVDIDALVEFAHSPELLEFFKGNRAVAQKFLDNADALKAAGAKYCNCFACQVGLEILAGKEILLA